MLPVSIACIHSAQHNSINEYPVRTIPFPKQNGCWVTFIQVQWWVLAPFGQRNKNIVRFDEFTSQVSLTQAFEPLNEGKLSFFLMLSVHM